MLRERRRRALGSSLDCPAVFRRAALSLLLAAALPGVAPAAAPSVPACALGTSGPDLRGFYADELA
jgi:hypothetical protein